MKIKIGSRVYSVKVCESHGDFEHMLHERGENDVTSIKSFVSYDESLIVVRPGMSSDVQNERVVHELLHAAIENSGLLNVDEQSQPFIEKIVSALTPRLMSLVKDNRSLFE